jgi:Flp pilus assembly protein TadG
MRALFSRLIAPLAGAASRLELMLAANGGVAAVEFAMVLPVMALMYLGMTEMTFAVNTDRKITLLSRTLADLTGRATSVSSTEMDTIFAASVSVMAPYRSDKAKMVVSSIVVKDTGQKDPNTKSPILKGTVCWSEARGGATALPKGSTVTVPEGFQTADSSYVRADVVMDYSPLFGPEILKWITGKSLITLDEQTPWPVRNVKEVILQGNGACL